MSVFAAMLKIGKRLFRGVFCGALLCAALCAPISVLGAGNDLRIEVLTQRYEKLGDAVLVSSGGKYLLMDTFLSSERQHLLSMLARRTRKLDLYVSHYHGDHYGNVKAILQDRRFRVGTLYLPEPQYITCYEWKSREAAKLAAAYRDMVYTARAGKTKVVYLSKGSAFRLGNAKVNILWGPYTTPTDSTNHRRFDIYVNNASLVAKVTVKGFSYLTAGDLSGASESAALAAGVDLSADVFKLSHHAGDGSNSKRFLRAVSPKYCFYQDGTEKIGPSKKLKTSVENALAFADVYSSRYHGRVVFQYKNGRLRTAVQRRKAFKKNAKGSSDGKRLGSAS